jgi:hypothetical protein
VYRSDDGGNTWPVTTLVNFSPANINDKPHLAVDTWPMSPYQDNIYVAWIWEIGGGPWSDIRFATALPGGAAFTFPQTPPGPAISDMPTGVCMGNGPNVAVANDGTIYVVWIDTDVTSTGQLPGTFYLDKSTDAGLTWGTDIPIGGAIVTLPSQLTDFQTPLSDVVARSFPCLEVSPTNPQELYLVYAADPDGAWTGDEADVFFTKSVDGGVTWSAPINLFPGATPWHQCEPWIDVKPDGTIDVAFYLGWAPDFPQSVRWEVRITRSSDGGATWTQPATLVNDVPSLTPINYWGMPWMGEYLGLVVDATDAHVAFTSSVNDQYGDVFYDRLDNSWIGAWMEPFDIYGLTNPLPDQSAWEPWGGDPTVGTFYATTTRFRSAPNSVEIDAPDDAVHQHAGYDQGAWIYTAWVYVPTGMTDPPYFILLNTYPADPNTTPEYWSLQLELDGATGVVRDRNGGATLPMVRDAWTEIRAEIDLDLDRQTVFYNNAHLVTKSWSEGVAPGGSLNIAAVNLFSNGATSPVYFDDLSLREDLRIPCPTDLDGDRIVGFSDLLIVLSTWGPQPAHPADFDGDGVVGFQDLLLVLSTWGACP